MNKKSVKLICMVLVTVLASAFFSGCSNTGNMDKNLQKLGIQGGKALKPVTLIFYFQGGEKPKEKEVLGKIEERVHDELNISLDFKWIPESAGTDMGVYEREMCGKISSKEKFDGFFVFNHKYMPDFDFATFARKGYLKDISGMLQKYAPLLYKKYSREQLQAATVDGKLYAVPNLYPRPKILCVVVREDLRKKYKLPEIKTFEDYEGYLKAVKNENIQGLPVGPMVIRGRDNSLSLFANALGYGIIDEKLQLVFKKDDPEMKALAWEQTPGFKKAEGFISRWEKQGYLTWYSPRSDETPSGEEMATKSIKDVFLSGYLMSMLSSTDNMADDLNAALLNSPDKGSWKFKAYTLYPDQKVPLASLADGCIAFKADSPNADRMLMLLNWLQSGQENYDLLMYGREGVDFTLEGQNYKLPKGYKTEYDCPYLGWPSREAFMNAEYERYPAGTPKGAKKEYNDFIRSRAAFLPTSGFYPDYSQIVSAVAARENYFDSMLEVALRDKEAGFEYSMVDNMKDSASVVINTVQGQLNTWRKNSGG